MLIGDVEIVIEAEPQQSWIATQVDDDCRVVVVDIWQGGISDGRIDLGNQDEGMSSAPFRPAASLSASSTSGGQSALNACKTAEQEIRHYGLGGNPDLLTRTKGKLSFCYTGSQIYNASYDPYGCFAKAFGWYAWVIDACYTITWINTSTYVEHHGAGDYHCSPVTTFPCNASTPDGYYHTLRAKEYAYPSGSAYCSGTYSGVVVRNPTQVIIQGCVAA